MCTQPGGRRPCPVGGVYAVPTFVKLLLACLVCIAVIGGVVLLAQWLF